MHSTEMEYKRKNTQDKNVSETIENIEVGIYNDDVTPASEALSISILELDVCAILAVIFDRFPSWKDMGVGFDTCVLKKK